MPIALLLLPLLLLLTLTVLMGLFSFVYELVTAAGALVHPHRHPHV